MIMDNDLYSQERMCILGMNFIKQTNGLYLIEGSNNRIVNEKEKLQLENDELVLEDIKCNKCAKDITKKVSKNKKRIQEIEKEVEVNEDIEETESVKE